MLKKNKHNNSKIYSTIYNKMEDNSILKYLNASKCLNSLIQTKMQQAILLIMEEVAILVVDNRLEETEVAQVVLEEDNKVEVLQADQGTKKHPYLLAIWPTMLILMK